VRRPIRGQDHAAVSDTSMISTEVVRAVRARATRALREALTASRRQGTVSSETWLGACRARPEHCPAGAHATPDPKVLSHSPRCVRRSARLDRRRIDPCVVTRSRGADPDLLPRVLLEECGQEGLGGLASSAREQTGQCGTHRSSANSRPQIVRDLGLPSRRSNATTARRPAARSKRSAGCRETRSTSGGGVVDELTRVGRQRFHVSTLPFGEARCRRRASNYPEPAAPSRRTSAVARDLHATSLGVARGPLQTSITRRDAETRRPFGRPRTSRGQDGLGLEIRVASPLERRAQMLAVCPVPRATSSARLPARCARDRSGLGQRSMTQSAAAMTSRWCSTASTACPPIDRVVRAPSQHGDVGEMESGRRLVEDVDPGPRTPRVRRVPRRCAALRLAARERGQGLPEPQRYRAPRRRADAAWRAPSGDLELSIASVTVIRGRRDRQSLQWISRISGRNRFPSQSGQGT